MQNACSANNTDQRAVLFISLMGKLLLLVLRKLKKTNIKGTVPLSLFIYLFKKNLTQKRSFISSIGT